VLPYFSTLLRQDILNRIVDLMKPGAYLFLDSSEAKPVDVTGLETIRNSTCKCYRKR
jgi:chemotaxis methyl-accepting protein methylase